MTSHIPLVEDEHVIGLDGKPLATMPVNAWTGLLFEEHPHIRQGEVSRRTNPHALLIAHVRSKGRSRIRSGYQTYELEVAPGRLDIFCSQFNMDHGWWDCTPGEVLAIDIDLARARSYVHDDLRHVDPVTCLATRDEVLERLLSCIKAEVDTGCTSGRLFAECLSLALIGRLASCYTADGGPSVQSRRLSARQLNRVIELIDDQLAGDLSVNALAVQLGMSAFAFARSFKSTVGISPHRFVVGRRIERAVELLRGDTPLGDIALVTGFSNQSHFTETFRRHTGRTPANVRRQR